jgi:hypothetical protein
MSNAYTRGLSVEYSGFTSTYGLQNGPISISVAVASASDYDSVTILPMTSPAQLFSSILALSSMIGAFSFIFSVLENRCTKPKASHKTPEDTVELSNRTGPIRTKRMRVSVSEEHGNGRQDVVLHPFTRPLLSPDGHAVN